MKRALIGLLLLTLLASMMLVGCGEEETTTTAAPATTATTAASTTTAGPATTAAPTTTAPPEPSALDVVIAAAEEEGEVNWMIGGHEYDGATLSQGIKDLFGVDIKVNPIPGDQRKTMSSVAMEIESGATPSYDLMSAASSNMILTMIPGNMVEEVDWATLVPAAGADANLIIPGANYPSTWGYVQVLAYDSSKTSPDDLPKTYQDFTDPKYLGKFGWVPYASANTEILYLLGKADDQGVQFLTDLVANKPLLAGYTELADKLVLGEIDFALMGSQEYNRISNTDPKYKALSPSDFCYVTENCDAILKGAENKNAATLLVLWLLTPEGQAYNNSTNFGNYLDPNSNEYKLVEDAKKAGIKVVVGDRDPVMLAWMQDPNGAKALEALIDPILKGARGQ